MNIHKNTRLLPRQREEIWLAYTQNKQNVTSLAKEYKVSRPTIYKILKLARGRLLKPQTSINNRFRQAKFGIKRLAKVEKSIQERLKKQAKRYNKSYPGEMVHVDTKRLPLLKGQHTQSQREYLFVAIDDYSRELYAAIMPDKTAFSAATFLTQHLIDPCPYTIEVIYSDNGTEYKGTKDHEFGKACYQHHINQKFTKVANPKTNGKAERVIRTLMQMWHDKHEFTDSQHRKQELTRFINFYNTVKPHSALVYQDQLGHKRTLTPYEYLEIYFANSVNNA
ncbi:IS481 family transposase [Pelistega sp. NLN82]|uniref:IS481 family transposase n=2 Tax=Pelistega ratti TaxID=2652177 RepID=A0A6L9Y7U3_9BURK|nr:integrase core domain-containing protein [Pelistega ratti]NEN76471.1 IS481 family transposase [Pelistega ratti]